jgi:hypothetical protein
MPSIGTTGREVRAAYARCNTWGTPASVTKQILLNSSEGMDSEPQFVTDESFGQTWLAEAETGDHTPRTPEVTAQLRYEDLDVWLAAACGSSAAPAVVSSVAANSLVAYSHAITLSDELDPIFTLAFDLDRYVTEIPSLKLRGFSLRIGENGRYNVAFPIVGAKANYDSVVNTAATVTGATDAVVAHRAFRKNTRIRKNVASDGALGASDESGLIRDLAFTYGRPLAQDDFVHNQDYIIEPEDDGFADLMVELTFARMNTVSANSLAVGLNLAKVFKMDWFSQGQFINSTTRRSILIEMPAAQIRSFRAPVTGHNQVRPVATYYLHRASAAPTGMAGLTNPFRMTIVNTNSATLI